MKERKIVDSIMFLVEVVQKYSEKAEIKYDFGTSHDFVTTRVTRRL